MTTLFASTLALQGCAGKKLRQFPTCISNPDAELRDSSGKVVQGGFYCIRARKGDEPAPAPSAAPDQSGYYMSYRDSKNFVAFAPNDAQDFLAYCNAENGHARPPESGTLEYLFGGKRKAPK